MLVGRSHWYWQVCFHLICTVCTCCERIIIWSSLTLKLSIFLSIAPTDVASFFGVEKKNPDSPFANDLVLNVTYQFDRVNGRQIKKGILFHLEIFS